MKISLANRIGLNARLRPQEVDLSVYNKTRITPEIGTLSSFARTTSTLVLNSDGYYQEVPAYCMASRGARYGINLFRDTANWGTANHTSSETLDGWAGQGSATIHDSNTFSLAAVDASLISSIGYGATQTMAGIGRVFGWLVKLSGPEGAQVRIAITQGSVSYTSTFKVITLSTTPKWFFVASTFSSGSDTSVLFRVRSYNSTAVSNITYHAGCPMELTPFVDQTIPHEYVSAFVGIGPELISNGDFSSSDVSAWATTNATAAVVNGELKITNTAASEGYAEYQVTTVNGEQYVIEFDGVLSSGSASCVYQVVYSGGDIVARTAFAEGTLNKRLIVTALGDYMKLRFKTNSTVIGDYATYDNVSIKSVNQNAGVNGVKIFDTDRSGITVDANGEVTFGTNAALAEASMLGNQTQPSRTQLVTYFNDLSQWTNNSGTPVFTANQINSPMKRTTIGKLQNDGSAAGNGKYRQVTLSNSTLYTYSALFRGGDSTLTRLGVYNTTSALWEAYVDVAMSPTTPSTSGSSGASNIAYTYNALWDLWRVTFNFTSSASAASQSTYIHVHPDRNNTSKYIYPGWFQIEAGSYATDPMPSTSATVNVGATTDAIFWPTGLVNNFKIKLEVYVIGIKTDTSSAVVFGVGTSTNYLILKLNYATSKFEFVVLINSVAYTVTANSAAVAGTSYDIELTYNNLMSMTIDSVVQTDTDAVTANMGWSDPELVYLGAFYDNSSNSGVCTKNFEVSRV